MQRIQELDFVKGCAILLVIFLHSATSIPSFIYTTFLELAIPLFIIVMGVTGYLSFTSGTFRVKRYLIGKFVRFFPAWILFYCVLIIFFGGQYYSRWWYYLFFLLPTDGPGNYFLGVIVQSIFIIPILCYSFQKDKQVTMVASFILSFSFELFGKALGDTLYEMLIVRYLFLLALGIYLGLLIKDRTEPRSFLMPFVYVSAIYLVVKQDALSTLSAFVPFFIVGNIVEYKINLPPINELGKASYHIFLAQIVVFAEIPLTSWLNTLISIILIVVIGYSLYRIERKLANT